MTLSDRLARLDALAQEATAQHAHLWALPDGCQCSYHLYIAEADPTTVRALVAVVRAADEHGICSCRYYPGYPRGERHAPECDGDPDLRAALSALEALP